MDNILLRSENLNEKAYQRLKQAIISNELAPGTRIVDSQIAEMFGISRTPARDAINRLMLDGLVVSKDKRGYYVLDVTAKDINELFDIRIMIEKGAIWYIASKSDTFPAREIEDILKTFDEQSQDSGNEFMRIDDVFHGMLISFSKNERLIKIYEDIKNQTKVFRQIQAVHKERTKFAMDTHVKVLFAIGDKDFNLAAELLEKHIERARSEALRVYQNND